MEQNLDNRYSQVREEIINRCKSEGACETEFKKLLSATTEADFIQILINNISWCQSNDRKTKILSCEIVEKFDNEVRKEKGIYVKWKQDIDTKQSVYLFGCEINKVNCEGTISYVWADGGTISDVRALNGGTISYVRALNGGTISYVRALNGGTISYVRADGGTISDVWADGGTISYVWALNGGTISYVRALNGGTISYVRALNGGTISYVRADGGTISDVRALNGGTISYVRADGGTISYVWADGGTISYVWALNGGTISYVWALNGGTISDVRADGGTISLTGIKSPDKISVNGSGIVRDLDKNKIYVYKGKFEVVEYEE